MKNPKQKPNSKKKDQGRECQPELCPSAQRELYLEHLMDMTLGVLDRGLRKN